MTEKQFIFISNTVATNLKTPISHNNKTMSIGEVLEKLNDLADENEQLKIGNNSLKLLVQNWEALDEEKDEQLDKQNQALKKLKKENEQLKSKNRGLQSELQIFKEDATHSNLQINKLADENEQLKKQLSDDFNQSNCITVQKSIVSDLKKENEELKQNLRMVEKRADKVYEENEQLKKDATTLIYANQDYRQQNQNLQKQLDYIQNSITNAIKHQKTELGQKALQEIIADYNEWMLGHKEAKE